MHSLTLSFLLVATSLAFPPTSIGKSIDRNQPIAIRSDHNDSSMEDNSDSTLDGNVTITQGTLEINSDRAIVHRGKDDIEKITLIGRPALMKQINDNGETMTAQAATIIYNLKTDLIMLSGGATIVTPRGSIVGEPIKFDLKTGRVDSGSSGNRVSMRIMPKHKVPEEAKP